MSGSPRKLRVVLVDDHQDTREMTAELLGAHGFDVRAFEAASGALAALRERPADVVITDIHLGRETGVDLARAIRDEPATREMAVIAVTGSAEHEPIARDDFDAFCLKPIDVDTFPETIRRLAESRHRGSGPR